MHKMFPCRAQRHAWVARGETGGGRRDPASPSRFGAPCEAVCVCVWSKWCLRGLSSTRGRVAAVGLSEVLPVHKQSARTLGRKELTEGEGVVEEAWRGEAGEVMS